MKIRLAGLIEDSLSNGAGIRTVIFAQGCRHNCDGCFNPETHSFDGGQIFEIDNIIEKINNNYMIDGVTFSGGDPLEQAYEFAYIAKNINKDLNVWCYTGYTFEQLIQANRDDWNELLKSIDVLVDGRFDKNKMEGEHKFRGSYNQRVINVKESLKENKVVLLMN